MTKHFIKSLLLILFVSVSFNGYSQLVGTGLVEDPVRNTKAKTSANSNYRIEAIAAVAYSDTLRLPFFEDFAGKLVSIDSIVISTTDNIVKVYDNSLNTYSNGTQIYIGFEVPGTNTIQDTLSRSQWYIKQIATGVFEIHPTSALTNPRKFFGTDVTYLNSYWRPVDNKYTYDVDTLKWLPDGNTYINNRYPLNPVSYNVATFDGLKSTGVPYNTVNVNSAGFTDNLTSLPINLNTLSVGDNVYLSFYWQHSGVGDAPESTDFLELQFKDNTGLWNPVDTISGNIAYMNNFKFFIIKLDDAKYFHKHFQFKIRSYGRMSGPFDIWNVDYLYLNKNRTAIDSMPFDLTIGNAEVSFLKNYTSMPYGQYFSNKAAETGSLNYSINNHYLYQGPSNFTYTYSMTCYYTEKLSPYLDSCNGPSHINISDGNTLTFDENCAHSFTTLVDISQPMQIDQTFSIALNDTANILYANNNRYRTSTVLWDYYAYDDGTPEWGVAANESGARVANQFTTNIKDTLTHIEIYFTRSKGPNMDGRSITLCVWDADHKLKSTKPIQVKYGGYIRYKLPSPVIIDAGKTFYVGYQQAYPDLLTIGYDKNYNNADKLYFSLGGSTWNKYSSQPGYAKGSMMIRAVFDKGQDLIATPIIEKENQQPYVNLYPIPATDLLKIEGKVTAISLYDLVGHKIASKEFDFYQEEKNIDVSTLANGIFIAEINVEGVTIVRKILVQHTY